MPAPKIAQAKIRQASIIQIDIQGTNKQELEAHLEGTVAVVRASATGSITLEKLKANELELVHLVIQPQDLKDAINDSPKVLDRLRDYGGDARVVNEIFVAMEARLARSFTAGASFDVEASALGLKIGARGGGSGSSTTEVTFSPGTTFAYLLQKPDWEQGKDRIQKLKDDQWGTR